MKPRNVKAVSVSFMIRLKAVDNFEGGVINAVANDALVSLVSCKWLCIL